MKRGFVLAAAALAVSLTVPFASHADTISPQCYLDGAKVAGATCSTTFELTADDAGRKISLLGTHADFHAVPSAGAGGTASLAWNDSTGALIAAYSCYTVAASADYNPTGTAGLACQATTPQAATWAAGTQTLTVTATELLNPGANGTRLHGRLALHSADDPV